MMHRKFLALLALMLCLALSVPALAAEGLSAFQNPQNAQPGAFSDVPSGSWYAAGVQAVSRRGIMNGTGRRASPRSRPSLGHRPLPLPRASTPPATTARSPRPAARGTSHILPMPRKRSSCPPRARTEVPSRRRPSPGRSWRACLRMCCAQRICPRSTTRPSRI